MRSFVIARRYIYVARDPLLDPKPFPATKAVQLYKLMNMWLNFALPQRAVRMSHEITQHDGRPRHWRSEAGASPSEKIPGRWVGLDLSVKWPPRSPGVTLLQFVFFCQGTAKTMRTVKCLQTLLSCGCGLRRPLRRWTRLFFEEIQLYKNIRRIA